MVAGGVYLVTRGLMGRRTLGADECRAMRALPVYDAFPTLDCVTLPAVVQLLVGTALAASGKIFDPRLMVM